MSDLRSQPTLIDESLGMFNPKADREWFGFDVYSGVMEHLKSIAGTMSDGKDDMIAGKIFAAR